ncbi:alpha-ketoglutarate-dependent dioxygenase AlkB [Microvirga sp. W0021]|uniref:Alpha-ketoglutarate-dependent dioxygenase AlkB n=1 Tax=Hohaiivirga grylli TaxID=3133970 RepID=A0ABV0BGJ1_9HYPH
MAALTLAPGLVYYPDYLDQQAQQSLLDDIRDIVRQAPLFTPSMPKTGKPFSVRMSNCGPLGWVSDVQGYRYQPDHPVTHNPWPPMPARLLAAWRELSGFAADPDACLINYYASDARMGLHQDKDEAEFSAPIVSLSFGATALFRYGLTEDKPSPTKSVRLRSGDAIVFGGPFRLVYHGIDRLFPGTSTLVPSDGRINLTLRKVTAVA